MNNAQIGILCRVGLPIPVVTLTTLNLGICKTSILYANSNIILTITPDAKCIPDANPTPKQPRSQQPPLALALPE